jgi:hypothetical protein
MYLHKIIVALRYLAAGIVTNLHLISRYSEQIVFLYSNFGRPELRSNNFRPSAPSTTPSPHQSRKTISGRAAYKVRSCYTPSIWTVSFPNTVQLARDQFVEWLNQQPDRLPKESKPKRLTRQSSGNSGKSTRPTFSKMTRIA